MECCRRDCVERISVHLKRGKPLRELFSVYKIISAGDFDLII